MGETPQETLLFLLGLIILAGKTVWALLVGLFNTPWTTLANVFTALLFGYGFIALIVHWRSERAERKTPRG